MATVDVPGVIYHNQRCICETYFVFYLAQQSMVHLMGIVYIHIGVGSDVVCSTAIGNARASIRGTDNRTIPRFFYVMLKYKPMLA